MAARFDANRARELGQTSGDGTPIMVTIPTSEPWVPLRILSLGLKSSQVVDADVFLLTDNRPTLRSGGTGLDLARSDAASKNLLTDLRSDKGMGWVPDQMWLSYLRVDTPAKNLDYDLAVSTHPVCCLRRGWWASGSPGVLRRPPRRAFPVAGHCDRG